MLEAIVLDAKRQLGRMDSPARHGRGGRKRAIKVTLRQLAVFEAIARCGEHRQGCRRNRTESVRGKHGAAGS